MSNNNNQSSGLASVIASSSVGTLIEWYDFYIFGSLATEISAKFFPSTNQTAALLSTLATFAAGFIVRPFGALFFGRLGDLIGRKYTFLVTLALMGGATFLIGCVPGYETIGFLAPILVLTLRLLQGLALGGEYGGAATYVAEHAPVGTRGYWTSWIQTTATLGLFVSLIVIIITRQSMDTKSFAEWGWRIPFWISILLVLVSVVIRLRMKESPLFAKIKAEGKVSANPLKESFGHKENFKMVLLALFGATMGQGVVWYTGQFYAQLFLKNTCKVDSTQVDSWLGIALLIATGGFVLFGWLSDKIGRKIIMMTGMACALLFTKPLFQQLYNITSPKGKAAQENLDKREAKETRSLPEGKTDSLVVTDTVKYYSDGAKYTKKVETVLFADPSKKPVGYAPKVTEKMLLSADTKWSIILTLLPLVLFVTMVYGPIAAFLVELFPTRIRYSSMSLPYHIGNGVFGGLVPFIGTLIQSYNPTNPLAGLIYPLSITAVCFLIGSFLLSNKIDEDVTD
jgi:MFS family permease